MPWLAEGTLAAAVLAVAAALAVPPAPRQLPRVAPPAAAADPAPEAERRPPAPLAAAAPQQVAALFGWRPPGRPRPAPAKPSPPATPVPPRLRQVGFVQGADGTASWVFKDSQTGAVLALGLGATSRGWTLVEVREQVFLLSFQGANHEIPRSR